MLPGAPTTVQTQLVDALRGMDDKEQLALAALLEDWLRAAKIDFATPPMLGEEEQQMTGAPA